MMANGYGPGRTRRTPPIKGHRCGDSTISPARWRMAAMKRAPRPATRSSYQEAASCSSASARGLKRRRLLATEAPLETSEDLVCRYSRYSASIDVLDAPLNFGFPVLPEIAKLQTCRELVDQGLTLLLRQLKRGFQNFLRLQHVPSIARPAHDGVSFCIIPIHHPHPRVLFCAEGTFLRNYWAALPRTHA